MKRMKQILAARQGRSLVGPMLDHPGLPLLAVLWQPGNFYPRDNASPDIQVFHRVTPWVPRWGMATGTLGSFSVQRCCTAGWCASHINTKPFLQCIFAADVSMCLDFFLLLAIFSPPRTANTRLSFLFSQFHDTYAANAPCFHLFFWLSETSTALPHSPSVRDLWLFGKCAKGKRKIQENLASIDAFRNACRCWEQA